MSLYSKWVYVRIEGPSKRICDSEFFLTLCDRPWSKENSKQMRVYFLLLSFHSSKIDVTSIDRGHFFDLNNALYRAVDKSRKDYHYITCSPIEGTEIFCV